MRSPSVLIGHTGLVGSNLLAARTFDRCFNSANIDEARGLRAGLLICAGLRGTKWVANRDPEGDERNMEALVDVLRSMQAAEAVLISTIDVYVRSAGRTELDPPEEAGNHPYGAHRARMERTFRECFPTARIVRLPIIYGAHLRKNVIWDLLTGHELHKLNSAAVHQYYHLRHLWDDIQRMRAKDMRTLNLATEPMSVRDMAAAVFGVVLDNPLPKPVHYDMRSVHAAAWGGTNGYLRSRDAVLSDLRTFVQEHPQRQVLPLPAAGR